MLFIGSRALPIRCLVGSEIDIALFDFECVFILLFEAVQLLIRVSSDRPEYSAIQSNKIYTGRI